MTPPVSAIGANSPSSRSSTARQTAAQQVALRYIKQMAQHRVVLERADGAKGPMKNFVLSLLHHPGAKIVFSIDGNMP